MTLPEYWKEACDLLARKDRIMADIISSCPREGLMRKNSAFHTLARAIIGQQISVKAADSVWNRLDRFLNNEICPKLILSADAQDMRGLGISERKVIYLKNIADFIVNDMAGQDDLKHIDHEELAKKLIEIKGIGNWTVEMFMIFHMQAPDIFPISDLGLINAVKRNYKIDDSKEAKEQCIELGEKFRPYRTVATWYLWRSIDPVPVEY